MAGQSVNYGPDIDRSRTVRGPNFTEDLLREEYDENLFPIFAYCSLNTHEYVRHILIGNEILPIQTAVLISRISIIEICPKCFHLEKRER